MYRQKRIQVFVILSLLLIGLIPMTQAKSEKVVVIGLDGASKEFMQSCIDKKGFENIQGLAESGSFRQMNSTLPPLTPSVMSSFLTGSDPGDHGVYGFEERDLLSYDTSVVSSRNLGKMLPQAVEGKSIMINVPMTYPAPEMNGVVVSGFPGSAEGKYVYPPNLKSDLEDRNYTVTTAGSFEDRKELKREVFTAFDKRKNITLDYMNKYDWNFSMVMFTGDARLMHFSSPECSGAIERYYRELDSFIGKVQEQTDDNTTIVLMSNHGFTELNKKIYLYTFLKENGYLEPKEVPYYKHMAQDLLGKALNFLGLSKGGEVSGKSFSSSYMNEIEWEETKAYTGGYYNGQIFLNMKGREPKGAVKPENYEEVRNNIIKDLKRLKDPQTGEKIVENIYTKEEIYNGSNMEKVPDIVVETPGYNHIAKFGFGNMYLTNPVEKSAPIKEGFVISNKKIHSEKISIIDLSTSVAASLGKNFGEGKNIFNKQ